MSLIIPSLASRLHQTMGAAATTPLASAAVNGGTSTTRTSRLANNVEVEEIMAGVPRHMGETRTEVKTVDIRVGEEGVVNVGGSIKAAEMRRRFRRSKPTVFPAR